MHTICKGAARQGEPAKCPIVQQIIHQHALQLDARNWRRVAVNAYSINVLFLLPGMEVSPLNTHAYSIKPGPRPFQTRPARVRSSTPNPTSLDISFTLCLISSSIFQSNIKIFWTLQMLTENQCSDEFDWVILPIHPSTVASHPLLLRCQYPYDRFHTTCRHS